MAINVVTKDFSIDASQSQQHFQTRTSSRKPSRFLLSFLNPCDKAPEQPPASMESVFEVISALFPMNVCTNILHYQYDVPLSIEIIARLQHHKIETLRYTIGTKLRQSHEAVAVLAIQIYLFIEKNRMEWDETIKTKPNSSLYFPSSEECPRSVQYNRDGTVFIHFSSHRRGDPIIGFGTRKKVKLALNYDTNQWHASAGINNDAGDGNEEVKALKLVRGMKHFTQLLYSVNYVKKGKQKTRIITELFSNFDLEKVFTRNLEWKIKHKMIVQLISGILDLHAKDYIHRDLKPANIFLRDNFEVVIGDVGSICSKYDLASRKVHRSTSWWSSPEYAKAKSQNQCLGSVTSEKHDIWALGCIIVDLWNDVQHPKKTNLPWGNFYEENIVYSLLSQYDASSLIYEPDQKDSIDHLVWSMLIPDPNKRITSQELRTKFRLLS